MKNYFLILLVSYLFITSAYCQKGLYLEYKAGVKGSNKITDTLKVKSFNGNSINILKNTEYPSRPIIDLYLKNDSDNIYSLFPNKTYQKISNVERENYKIDVIGNENINGYNCVKVIVSTQNRSDGGHMTVWICKDIPSFEDYLTAIVNNLNLKKLHNALVKEKLDGIPIRIELSEEKSLQFDLVKVAFMIIDESIFSLKNYHEAKMSTSDDLKKQNKVSKEQYDAMKVEEMKAKMEEESKSKK